MKQGARRSCRDLQHSLYPERPSLGVHHDLRTCPNSLVFAFFALTHHQCALSLADRVVSNVTVKLHHHFHEPVRSCLTRETTGHSSDKSFLVFARLTCILVSRFLLDLQGATRRSLHLGTHVGEATDTDARTKSTIIFERVVGSIASTLEPTTDSDTVLPEEDHDGPGHFSSDFAATPHDEFEHAETKI